MIFAIRVVEFRSFWIAMWFLVVVIDCCLPCWRCKAAAAPHAHVVKADRRTGHMNFFLQLAGKTEVFANAIHSNESGQGEKSGLHRYA
jgi:dipeptide/tripeptide permease